MESVDCRVFKMKTLYRGAHGGGGLNGPLGLHCPGAQLALFATNHANKQVGHTAEGPYSARPIPRICHDPIVGLPGRKLLGIQVLGGRIASLITSMPRSQFCAAEQRVMRRAAGKRTDVNPTKLSIIDER